MSLSDFGIVSGSSRRLRTVIFEMPVSEMAARTISRPAAVVPGGGGSDHFQKKKKVERLTSGRASDDDLHCWTGLKTMDSEADEPCEPYEGRSPSGSWRCPTRVRSAAQPSLRRSDPLYAVRLLTLVIRCIFF